MLFPNFICVDNFFDNPDEVVNLSKKFQYENKTHCPGKRTKPLHEVDWAFFNWVNLKIGSVLYPNHVNDLRFKSYTYFQKVQKLDHDSWVHTDNKFKATAIIYLNKENTAGTSIFSPKDFKATLVQKHTDTKYEYFTKEENRTKELEEKVGKAKEDNNKNFQKTFSVEGIYNRLIIFDGNSYHAANPMTSDKERLTLITFFDDISLNDKVIKYPVPTARSI
jgi:hypothetical protein